MRRFDSLTKYLDLIPGDEIGHWVIERVDQDDPNSPVQWPWVRFSEMAEGFIYDFYDFMHANEDLIPKSYLEILEEKNLNQYIGADPDTYVSKLDAQCAIAMITQAVRAERFCDGALLGAFQTGTITKLLERLREIDDTENQSPGSRAENITFEIRPLDLSCDEMVLGCLAVSTACFLEIEPDYCPPSSKAFLDSLRQEDVWTRHYLVALGADHKTVMGWASTSYSDDVLDPVFIDVSVAPPYRRQGIGTALEAAARDLYPTEHGAKQFCAESYLPGGINAATHPITQWAEKLGWKFNELDHTLRLAWPADRNSLLEIRPAIPDGYEIKTYLDGVPEELQESLGVVIGEMDAEAPSGEIEYSASPLTPAEYQADLANLTATGAHLIETVAIYQGEVVGFTRIQVPAETNRVMRGRGTGVRNEHRGNRLGLLLKTQIEIELLDRGFITHPAIETETAVDNPWMLAIQKTLGFEEYSQLAGYVRAIE